MMDWKLELVVVPVSDIDRAKTFYVERTGFQLDVDFSAGDFRVVQLTPPGSACSISLMTTTKMAPGAIKGVHLVVTDIEAARSQLVERGADPGEVYHFDSGTQTAGPHPARGDYESFLNLADPDGNEWVVQEVGHPAVGVPEVAMSASGA